MINKINAFYFSGTGTTRKVVLSLAMSLAEKIQGFEREKSTVKKVITVSKTININNMDFSLPEKRQKPQSFTKEDLVVVGIPTYAGRVPNILLSYLNSVKGNGAQAVAVVLYGNRDFEDALIELTDILSNNGFKVVAAGGFIGEHAFSKLMAKGRPDAMDMKKIEGFAGEVYAKISRDRDLTELLVSGQKPYRNYYQPKDRYGNLFDFRVITPHTNKAVCIECKHCAEICTMDSISHIDTSVMKGICIKCCACVKGCPVEAKYFDDENYLKHQHELEEIYSERREPVTFV